MQLFGTQAQPVHVLEVIVASFHRFVPAAFLMQVTAPCPRLIVDINLPVTKAISSHCHVG